jgi:hypothetical protein
MRRKHLSHWITAQQEEEKMLKKAIHQLNLPCLSDDVAIDIEDPIVSSSEVGGSATTSVSPLQEEEDELSDPEAGEEETSVSVRPKLRKQVTLTENVEMTVSHKCSIFYQKSSLQS